MKNIGNDLTRFLMGTIFLVIRLFHIQYKTLIAEACDYFQIARWTK